MFVKQELLLILLFASLVVIQCARRKRKRGPGRCPRKEQLKTGEIGSISTPGYPVSYSKRQICLWRIRVPKGYTVHLDFHDKFGVHCKTRDRVAVSSRRLFFRPKPRGSLTTVVLCGVSRMLNVTVPDTDMWVRFQAHGTRDRPGVGFKATYRALDNDECKDQRRCSQNCINIPGSYRCSCNSGFQLAEDGFNCTVIPEYKVQFSKTSYQTTIARWIPLNTKVLTARAYVTGTNQPIKYSIVRRYPKPNRILKYPFRISPTTGEITSRRHLPDDINDYQMTIKAEVNSKSYAKVTVHINVSLASANISSIKFSSTSYSVIITDNLKRGKPVLQLAILPSTSSYHVTYNLSDKNRFFHVDHNKGCIKVKRDLSELRLRPNSAKRFEFTVVSRLRDKKTVAASVVVKIIVIPAYFGDRYRLSLGNKRDRQPMPIRDKRPPTRSEFTYHRFFRQLSPMARKISKAERQFDEAIRDLRERVVHAFKDQRLRRPGVVITNLPPIALASHDKLQELINATHCVIPKADCNNETAASSYRTFDGTCNNLRQPLWGAANMPFTRILPAKYWDDEGRGEPIGFPNQKSVPFLPSPHLISQKYVLHREYGGKTDNKFSHMMMQWGQFLDHDITFTAESDGSELCAVPRCDGTPADYESPCYPIVYPSGDECTMFTRSAAACQTDPKNIKNREQLNLITSYIDGSQIYGSSDEQARSLRDDEDGRGYLAMNATYHILPELKDTLNPPLNLCQFSGGCFAAGDLRANEQIVLASMHTLWVREHNRLATFLKYVNPHWDSEKLFQEARKIVMAELQHITFREYLTKFLGEKAIPEYTGYKEDVDATIYNSFATSAFRAGHSMVRPAFARLDENYEPIGPDVPLVRAFFNNKLIREDGIEPFILGLLGNVSETIDRGMAAGLTKHLFQQKGSEHGFDLAALNIQRGRDHGLPGYGSWRRECGLTDEVFFDQTQSEISNSKAREILRDLYGTVEYSDLWVAGLAENHVPGAMVGPTFHCILKKQFIRLRDGDRYWYENPGVFTPEQLTEIKKVTLSRVICDNLVGVVSVQRDAFLAATKDTQRVECRSGLLAMNMSKWKEDEKDLQAEDPGLWTDWHDTNRTPTGSWGALDDLSLCGNNSIKDIQCETADGRKAKNSGARITCSKEVGFYCRNIEQGDGKKCGDYRFRVLCSRTEKRKVRELPSETTDASSANVDKRTKCDPKFSDHYYQVTTLDASATKGMTIFSRSESYTGSGYLYLGRYKEFGKHRALVQFDLRRVSRRSILLSATLQLFLVSAGDTDKNVNYSVEVHPITSTDWHEKNATAAVPWNEDFLGINSDVDKRSKATSGLIQSKDKGKWINIDIFKTVFNWQISRRRRNNYGLLVKLVNEERAQSLLHFTSNLHKNPNIRPRILVCLNMPPW